MLIFLFGSFFTNTVHQTIQIRNQAPQNRGYSYFGVMPMAGEVPSVASTHPVFSCKVADGSLQIVATYEKPELWPTESIKASCEIAGRKVVFRTQFRNERSDPSLQSHLISEAGEFSWVAVHGAMFHVAAQLDEAAPELAASTVKSSIEGVFCTARDRKIELSSDFTGEGAGVCELPTESGELYEMAFNIERASR